MFGNDPSAPDAPRIPSPTDALSSDGSLRLTVPLVAPSDALRGLSTPAPTVLRILPALAAAAIDETRPKTPWGHNGLGEIVYLRTYARPIEGEGRLETWPETIERVIRGTRQINARLTPDEEDRLRDHMLALRGTVSGRALWTLGTPLVAKAGMDSLVNCWFTTITKAEDFRWLMDRLMVGGGVGFSVERANAYQFPKVKATGVVHERTTDADYIVPDTRTGWSELVERAVNAHFSGKGFTYSTLLVRPAGAPLRTFGGTASGPTALIEGVEDICKVMCARDGKRLRSVDVLDIANIIGRVVVAGSARRSAQIALGDPDDVLFLRAKRWANGTIPAWRGNSNNTLIVDHFSEIADDAGFWRNFDGGSEPYGLFNRRLARSMGRLGEKRADPSVEGMNPCFAADTRVLTADGWRSFPDLVGADPVLIQDARVTGTIVDGEERWAVDPTVTGTVSNRGHQARVTARQRQLYRLTTTDGHVVRATDDHHFATPTGMTMLRDLRVEDELLVALPDPSVADSESLDWRTGYLLGLITSDGYVDRPHRTATITIWDAAGILDQEVERLEALTQRTITDLVEREPALTMSNGRRPVTLTPHFAGAAAASTGKVAKRALRSRVLGALIEQRGWSKRDLDWVHHESRDFKAGFVSGLFYGDGSIQDARGSLSWRLAQSDRSFLANVSLILQELGVRASIHHRRPATTAQLPDGHGGRRDCDTRANYELIISGRQQNDRAAIALQIPPHHRDRFERLMARYSKSPCPDPDVTRVASIELDVIEDVWCLSEDVRRTLVAEGLTARRCGEAQLADRESCNLATIWLPNVRSLEDFLDVSHILYKIQKATSLLSHSDPETEAIVHRNMRLGQSLTGILQATDEQRSWVRPAYDALRAFDREWSRELGVPESIRLTVIQPGGTLSILAGETSGIHSAYARFYVRRVRFGASDPLVDECRRRGYPVVQEVGLDGKPDHSRLVVEFPCEAPPGTPLASEMSAIEQLEWVRWAQENWTDQSCSITVLYRPAELPAIKAWLSEHYDDSVKSVSFLRYSDHGFNLAPYEPIEPAEYRRRAARVRRDGPLVLMGQTTLDEESCATGACPVR